MFKPINTLQISTLILFFSCNSNTEIQKDEQAKRVKICNHAKDFSELINEWNTIGINSVFTDENLIKNQEFMKLCKKILTKK